MEPRLIFMSLNEIILEMRSDAARHIQLKRMIRQFTVFTVTKTYNVNEEGHGAFKVEATEPTTGLTATVHYECDGTKESIDHCAVLLFDELESICDKIRRRINGKVYSHFHQLLSIPATGVELIDIEREPTESLKPREPVKEYDPRF